MNTRILLRFDEPFDAVLPTDSAGQLEDMATPTGQTMPSAVSAFTGIGREFVAADGTALVAVDAADGNTTLTRTMSVQAIVRWDITEQGVSPGIVIARGKDDGSATERVAFALELSVVNLAARVGEMRLWWQNSTGTIVATEGAWFIAPDDGDSMLITATRRWVSSSEVITRYFIGAQLIGEFVEVDGDIGGSTTGLTMVGSRYDAASLGWAWFFDGVIDEIRCVDYELATEEIEATWQRITEYQEMGVQLYIEQHPPGWPVSFDPSTRSGREASLIGQALGYAAAQIENFRANLMPDRAYGRVLERWEHIVGVEPRHGDSVEQRRARMLSRMRQRAGVSPDGVRVALEELLATDSENIEVIAFSNIIEEDFTELRTQRWLATPSADFSIVANALQIDVLGTPALFPYQWSTLLTGVDGPARIGGYGGQLFAEVNPSTLPDGGETGICLYDHVRKDALVLGIRRVGVAYRVYSQRYVAGVSVGETLHATTSNTPHWLHIGATPVDYSGQAATDLVEHFVRWSTTSATAGFTTADPGDFSFCVGWCGLYARGYDGGADVTASPFTVEVESAKLFFPNGRRPFYFYAMRDPDLPGEYDLASASATLKKLKQAHTHAAAITSLDVLCDDPDSGCGLGPCGGF